MSYQIFLKNSVSKFLDKIINKDYKLVSDSIESLVNNPRSLNSKKILSNKKNIYRVRIDRFRIIYYIDGKNKTIIILEVKYRREDTYKDY